MPVREYHLCSASIDPLFERRGGDPFVTRMWHLKSSRLSARGYGFPHASSAGAARGGPGLNRPGEGRSLLKNAESATAFGAVGVLISLTVIAVSQVLGQSCKPSVAGVRALKHGSRMSLGIASFARFPAFKGNPRHRGLRFPLPPIDNKVSPLDEARRNRIIFSRLWSVSTIALVLCAYSMTAKGEPLPYGTIAVESHFYGDTYDTVCRMPVWAANIETIEPSDHRRRDEFELEISRECVSQQASHTEYAPNGCVKAAVFGPQDDFWIPGLLSCAALALADRHEQKSFRPICHSGAAEGRSRAAAEQGALESCTYWGGGGCTIVYSECATLTPVSSPVARGLALSGSTATVNEGSTASYTVALTRQPTAAVTVTPSSGDPAAVRVSQPLTFTTENWTTAQPVWVTGVADADGSDETVTVTHTAAGGGYDGVTGTVTVEVADKETSPITGVCDRTPQVRDAIVERLSLLWESPPRNCRWVTDYHLASIDELHVSGQGITALKEGDFAGLSGLTTLGLTGNELTNLPPDVFSELSSLTTLHLDRNDLTELPAGLFSDLSSLKRLYLSSNNLTTLRRNVLSGLSSLEKLYLDDNNGLSGNRLTVLPGSFFGLSNLETLDLSDSRLAPLPVGVFAGLSSLEELDLSGNDLADVPTSVFSGLSSLKKLDLSRNDLITLPAGIFDGLALEDLDLSFNPGAPFTATLELFRADNEYLRAPGPATVAVKLVAGGRLPFPEGPSPMPVALPFDVGGYRVYGGRRHDLALDREYIRWGSRDCQGRPHQRRLQGDPNRRRTGCARILPRPDRSLLPGNDVGGRPVGTGTAA